MSGWPLSKKECGELCKPWMELVNFPRRPLTGSTPSPLGPPLFQHNNKNSSWKASANLFFCVLCRVVEHRLAVGQAGRMEAGHQINRRWKRRAPRQPPCKNLCPIPATTWFFVCVQQFYGPISKLPVPPAGRSTTKSPCPIFTLCGFCLTSPSQVGGVNIPPASHHQRKFTHNGGKWPAAAAFACLCASSVRACPTLSSAGECPRNGPDVIVA